MIPAIKERRNYPLKLRLIIYEMYKASRILSSCQYYIADCADELERLTKENKCLRRKLNLKNKKRKLT
jgi:hypothetical protein